MSDVKSRPGVMIYFEAVRPALSRLDNEQCGALFRAIIDYAEYGAVADLDSMAGMAFDLLRPKIDRDAEKYEESREQRQHAVYVREAKRRGEEPLTLSEWRTNRELSSDNGPISPDIESNGPYPSTTSSTASSPSASTSPAASTTTTSPGAWNTLDKDRGVGKGETTFTAFSPLSEVDFVKKRDQLLRSLGE